MEMFHLKVFSIIICKEKRRKFNNIYRFQQLLLIWKLYFSGLSTISVSSASYTSQFGHVQSFEQHLYLSVIVSSESTLLVTFIKYIHPSFMVIALETAILGSFQRLWKLQFCEEKIVQQPLTLMYLLWSKTMRIGYRKTFVTREWSNGKSCLPDTLLNHIFNLDFSDLIFAKSVSFRNKMVYQFS